MLITASAVVSKNIWILFLLIWTKDYGKRHVFNIEKMSQSIDVKFSSLILLVEGE